MSEMNNGSAELHSVLQKQVAKHLPQQYLHDAGVMNFLGVISRYYANLERDKKMSEHAFAISEKEYQEVLADISHKNSILYKAIDQLKVAVAAMQPGEESPFTSDGDDIAHIIDYLMRLIRQSKELEQHLIDAKNDAEKAFRVKSDFLSVMSHEIRTPLNAIIGYIHLLTQEDPKPEQLEYLNILTISARNLMSLINDVLDFSKIEEGKITFADSDMDIRRLIHDVKLANQVRAEENGNALKVMIDEDAPQYVAGDITRLTQVLNNLVSNAIKFTKNGRITIELQLVSGRDGYVDLRFSVKDTGIGISIENQARIFDRFTQAHDYITREFGGSGLGLTIIKRLLNLMGSEIMLTSEPGVGSEFYFTLTMKEAVVPKVQQKVAEDYGDDLKGIHILLVEDLEFNALLARKMLERWGAVVSHAQNGLVAVEMVRDNTYDAILMDVQMPVMDGLTASAEIRKFDNNTHIVALTASTSPEMQQQFTELGISAFVFKPIDPDNLFKTLNRILRKYHA